MIGGGGWIGTQLAAIDAPIAGSLAHQAIAARVYCWLHLPLLSFFIPPSRLLHSFDLYSDLRSVLRVSCRFRCWKWPSRLRALLSLLLLLSRSCCCCCCSSSNVARSGPTFRLSARSNDSLLAWPARPVGGASRWLRLRASCSLAGHPFGELARRAVRVGLVRYAGRIAGLASSRQPPAIALCHQRQQQLQIESHIDDRRLSRCC